MYKISHVQPQITYLMLPGCLLKNMFLLFSKKKEVQYGPVYQYLQRNWIIFSLYTFIYAPIKQVMVGTLSAWSILNYQLRMWIFYSYAFLFFFSKFTKSLPWFLSFISICKCSLCAVLCLVTQSCLTLWTPWTVVCQSPLSMGFPKQEYWHGLPCPSPGDLPNPGLEPRCLTLQADSLATEP